MSTDNDEVNMAIVRLEAESPIREGNGKWAWIAGEILDKYPEYDLTCNAVRKRFEKHRLLAKNSEIYQTNEFINSYIVKEWETGEYRTYRELGEHIRDTFGLKLSRSAVRQRYGRAKGLPEKHGKVLASLVKEPRVQVINNYTTVTSEPKPVERVPEKEHQGYGVDIEINDENTIIIPDLQLPFVKKGFLEFCMGVRDRYNCTQAVNIGDVGDQNQLSSFLNNVNGFSAGEEADEVVKEVERWHKEFPYSYVCIGNHDFRYYKAALRAGLPVQYLKTFNEVLGTPTWNWGWSFIQYGDLGPILYTHGKKTGKFAHRQTAEAEGSSVVMGHTHYYAGVEWIQTRFKRFFALAVGCGIDYERYAFEYGYDRTLKPQLGCGVVLEHGTRPMFIPYWG